MTRSGKFRSMLGKRWFLAMLAVVNGLGSLYGFYWYKDQVAQTPPQWLIFVPDSPLASTFFTIVILLFLFSRRSPLLEAFAAITLFKYGIWAVVMIVWTGVVDPRPFLDALPWQDWMLMASHLAMAVQALLYLPFYTYRQRDLAIAGGWILLNDAMDYGLNLHPWLSYVLDPFIPQVAIFTVLLSLTTIFLFTTLTYWSRGRE